MKHKKNNSSNNGRRYSLEEKTKINEFLKKCSLSDQVDTLYKLCEIIDPPHSIDYLNTFVSNLREKERYSKKLKTIKKSAAQWGKYADDLESKIDDYFDSLIIKEAFDNFKKEHPKKCSYSGRYDVFYRQLEDSEIAHKIKHSCSDENFIRHCTFRKDAKNAIKKPALPDYAFYSTSEDILVDNLSNDSKLLSEFGIENLYVVNLMLINLLDDPDRNYKEVITIFLIASGRYCYSKQSKKGKENAAGKLLDTQRFDIVTLQEDIDKNLLKVKKARKKIKSILSKRL